MIDKFIVRTKDKPLEILGVGYTYYLNEDKTIIFTTDKNVICCPNGVIIDIIGNAKENENNEFESEMESIYYDKFKQTFCDIAKVIVQEKINMNDMFD